MGLKLYADLHDITGKPLVKANVPINLDIIQTLIKEGDESNRTFVSFGDTPFFKNFSDVFKEEKYYIVFDKKDVNKNILDVMAKTQITKSILSELRYMQDNLPYTFRHTFCVTALSVKRSIGMKDNKCNPNKMALAGLAHDLGKSRIPKAILGKTTPLKQSEFNFLRTHSLISYLLVCYYLGDSHKEVLEAVRDHHEKLDGSGYPLNAKSVSNYTGIITVMDIFDALISERPYRTSPFSIRYALDYLIEEASVGKVDRHTVYNLAGYVKKGVISSDTLKPAARSESLENPKSCYGKIIPDN